MGRQVDRLRVQRGFRGRLLLCGAVVLSVEFLSSSAHAFRSGKDLSQLAGTDRVRTATDSISFQIHSEVTKGLSYQDVQTAASAAATTWMAPACTGIRFVDAGSTSFPAKPEDGVSTIQWVSDWADRGFDPQAAAMTDVQYIKEEGDQWRIAEADIYMNAGFSWSTSGQGKSERDVQAVLTHELGHVLGLLHPCELDGADGAPVCDSSSAQASAAMYPAYSVNQRALSQDDIDGVCFLYPARSCSETGCAPNEVCTPEGCQTPCGDTTCMKGWYCTPTGCKNSGCLGSDCVGLPCNTESECAAGEACVAGKCKKGTGEAGDPCAKSSDCAIGACAAKGYCTRPCVVTADCAKGETCEVSGGIGVCSSKLAPFGGSCATADDCLGAVCLQIDEPAVCTRSCAIGRGACPGGTVCSAVEGQPVCVPASALEESGGCSIGGAGERPGALVGFVVAIAMIAATRKRDRRDTAEKGMGS